MTTPGIPPHSAGTAGSGALFSLPIPTYIINLKSRTDRKDFITKEFATRQEFNVEIIEACEHSIGAIGLWESIRKIVQLARKRDETFVIICEDDHEFTSAYSTEGLLNAISAAHQLDADVLSGGTSWFTGTFQCADGVYWMEKFSGTQFLVIFDHFFDAILDADFGPGDDADYKICALTEKRFMMCPFISVQKDFGYSDATSKNNMLFH